MKYPKPTDRYDCSVLCENFEEIDERLLSLELNSGGTGGGGGSITIDTSLSETSANPVQNKVITKQLKNMYTKTEIDALFGAYVDDIAALIGS